MPIDARLEAVQAALRAIASLHRPLAGEATADPNQYCAICVSPSGRARVWPCRTRRLADETLAVLVSANVETGPSAETPGG